MFGQVLTWQDPQMAALGSAEGSSSGLLVEMLGEHGFILVSSLMLAVGLRLLEQQQQRRQEQKWDHVEGVTTTVHKWGM